MSSIGFESTMAHSHMPEGDRRNAEASARSLEAELRRVSVLEQECVKGRGTGQTRWFVHDAKGWIAAAEHPASSVSELPTSPGIVWARHIELAVRVGAMLMRVTSEPSQDDPRSLLDHLLGGPRSARQVSRSHYVVGPSGALKPLVGRAGRI